MATYGKRFVSNTKKGKRIAEILGINPDSEGRYHTERGCKTAEGFYRTVKAALLEVKKI